VAPAIRRLPPRRETVVRAAPEARFERATTGGTERVELREGRVELDVRPLLSDERFLVATADAEVEVRGTVFDVEAHEGRLVRVEVLEGKVIVRHGGKGTLVRTGEAWANEPEPQRAPELRSLPRPAPRAREAPESPARPPVSPTFAEGVRAVERGDYAHGAQALEHFRAASPNDPRAEDASYLAILALQRAGQHGEAVAAARRFLAQYPHSPRRGAVESLLGP
jgi:ferric-dicitrate binding protein FerR (iron transport regulator)